MTRVSGYAFNPGDSDRSFLTDRTKLVSSGGFVMKRGKFGVEDGWKSGPYGGKSEAG